jgi:hypothetical protein
MAMTKAEFLTKYGDVKVVFSSYYKFTFDYSAELEDGTSIVINVGGRADEIYRHEVSPNNPEKISDLDPYGGTVFAKGTEIEGFYDY